jgi:ABC-type dipeptide/oligopeptide/nickel transport system permease component
MTGSLFDTDPFTGRHLQLQNLVLPALTLGIRPLAIIAQLTRGALLDVLDQDYIRTAYAKGSAGPGGHLAAWPAKCPEPGDHGHYRLVCRAAGGGFFVETIFGWKGIGKVTVDALEKLDFPVVMGSVLVTSCFFIVVGLLSDLLYGLVDPRVRNFV